MAAVRRAGPHETDEVVDNRRPVNQGQTQVKAQEAVAHVLVQKGAGGGGGGWRIDAGMHLGERRVGAPEEGGGCVRFGQVLGVVIGGVGSNVNVNNPLHLCSQDRRHVGTSTQQPPANPLDYDDAMTPRLPPVHATGHDSCLSPANDSCLASARLMLRQRKTHASPAHHSRLASAWLMPLRVPHLHRSVPDIWVRHHQNGCLITACSRVIIIEAQEGACEHVAAGEANEGA